MWSVQKIFYTDPSSSIEISERHTWDSSGAERTCRAPGKVHLTIKKIQKAKCGRAVKLAGY